MIEGNSSNVSSLTLEHVLLYATSVMERADKLAAVAARIDHILFASPQCAPSLAADKIHSGMVGDLQHVLECIEARVVLASDVLNYVEGRLLVSPATAAGQAVPNSTFVDVKGSVGYHAEGLAYAGRVLGR